MREISLFKKVWVKKKVISSYFVIYYFDLKFGHINRKRRQHVFLLTWVIAYIQIDQLILELL